MNFPINVKEKTFKKNLVNLGYVYKIIQYESMISAIKRIILKDITTSIKEENLIETIKNIFNYEIPLSILENRNEIKYITEDYLISIIENGLLDLYLEDEFKSFNLDIQQNAYRMEIIDKVNFINKRMKDNLLYQSYSFMTDKNSSKYINAKKCLLMNGIVLSYSEKEEIKSEINILIKIIFIDYIEDVFKLSGYINKIYLNRIIRTQDIVDFFFNEILPDNILNSDIDIAFISFDQKELIDNPFILLKKDFEFSEDNLFQLISAIRSNNYKELPYMFGTAINPTHDYDGDDIWEYLNIYTPRKLMEKLLDLKNTIQNYKQNENIYFSFEFNGKKETFNIKDIVEYSIRQQHL